MKTTEIRELSEKLKSDYALHIALKDALASIELGEAKIRALNYIAFPERRLANKATQMLARATGATAQEVAAHGLDEARKPIAITQSDREAAFQNAIGYCG